MSCDIINTIISTAIVVVVAIQWTRCRCSMVVVGDAQTMLFEYVLAGNLRTLMPDRRRSWPAVSVHHHHHQTMASACLCDIQPEHSTWTRTISHISRERVGACCCRTVLLSQ
jgi:hypothetical protein